MSNKKTVLNEMQVRRWGKLAAIGKPLTENWLDALTEEDDEEEGEEGMTMDMDMGMPGGEAPAEEAPAEEAPSGDLETKVEDIVAAVVDAISNVTDVDISMDADAEDADGSDGDDDDDDDDEEPAMREPAMPAMRDEDQMEGLGLDFIDDDELTEAVLKRVIGRLRSRSK